jgi:protein-cysteine N-palmitoyltransferase HHAT
MWHRGFNQWLVRYLYVPLGGNRSLLSVVATIAFVAFWHDHTLNIVIWAFALVLFILPEILIKRYARQSLGNYFPLHWFKYLAALSSAIYIYFLVFSNIVGFGYGVDKLYLIWEKIQREWAELLWSIAVLISAVILMFYQRATEDGNKNF